MPIGDYSPAFEGSWEKNTMSDFKALQKYYRGLTNGKFPVSPQPQTPAADVLLALSKYDATLSELRQATRLPYSYFPIQHNAAEQSAMSLSYLARYKQSTWVIQLRALAELQNNQPDKALDDVLLGLRLTETLRSSPLLISHLVRIAMFDIMLQPIYEGLAQHRWSDAQLTDLSAQLNQLDFLEDYQHTMHGELVFNISGTENFRENPLIDINFVKRSKWLTFLWSTVPGGFYYQNELAIARLYQFLVFPMTDPKKHLVFPNTTNWDKYLKESRSFSPYKIFANMMIPALQRATFRFAYSENVKNMALVAIALERYRLAHGEYPENLDSLAPQFIDNMPHDIMSGEPLLYRRETNGLFTLYSVGWNQTDDGGKFALLKKSSMIDRFQGDWVWKYPESITNYE